LDWIAEGASSSAVNRLTPPPPPPPVALIVMMSPDAIRLIPVPATSDRKSSVVSRCPFVPRKIPTPVPTLRPSTDRIAFRDVEVDEEVPLVEVSVKMMLPSLETRPLLVSGMKTLK
jgi:hypothetical protein